MTVYGMNKFFCDGLGCEAKFEVNITDEAKAEKRLLRRGWAIVGDGIKRSKRHFCPSCVSSIAQNKGPDVYEDEAGNIYYG